MNSMQKVLGIVGSGASIVGLGYAFLSFNPTQQQEQNNSSGKQVIVGGDYHDYGNQDKKETEAKHEIVSPAIMPSNPSCMASYSYYYYNISGDIDNGSVESKHHAAIGLGSIYKQIKIPQEYQGKKLKFTAEIKATNVEVRPWTDLWIKRGDQYSTEGDGGGEGKSYYRRYSPIRGTTNWTKMSIAIDTLHTTFLSYGITLHGKGKIEIRNGFLSLD